ncbi:MAG: DHH family phosphoesterase [Bacteroidales bacterium]|nr:DHH family phosphoesterase [Bacteroidales bacterium]
MEKEVFQKLKQLIQQPTLKVVILSHTHPDGDSIGSSLALLMLLQKLGHHVQVIFPDDIPSYYLWMPEIDKILIARKELEKCKSCIESSDVIFFVDMNALHRTDILADYLLTVKSANSKIFILIDHHENPEKIFEIELTTIHISSTSEILLEFINYLDKSLLDKDIATCLFTGIITDTNRFAYGNFTDKTLELTAELMRYGIYPKEIHEKIYNTYTESRLKLLGYALLEKLTILPEFKSSYMTLSKAELRKFNYQKGDTEGLVNFGLRIQEIGITALFLEFERYIKISFRSEEKYNVNYIATKYFQGGGHRNASGAFFYGDMESAVSLFIKALDEAWKNGYILQ